METSYSCAVTQYRNQEGKNCYFHGSHLTSHIPSEESIIQHMDYRKINCYLPARSQDIRYLAEISNWGSQLLLSELNITEVLSSGRWWWCGAVWSRTETGQSPHPPPITAPSPVLPLRSASTSNRPGWTLWYYEMCQVGIVLGPQLDGIYHWLQLDF